MDDETRTTGPKEAYEGFRIDAGKSVPLLGSDPRLPCAERLPVDKAPPRPDQEPGPRREASRPGRDDRVEISPPGPAAALGFPRVNDGPRLRRVWGLLLASGLILAVLGMGLQNEGGRSLAGTPARPIRVLVLDWLNDPVLEALRSQDYLGLCPSFLVNTREKEFWARLNNSGQVKVFARSPSHPIQDSLREIEPDVVVLANICLDLEDRWGLGRDERIDLIQYLERGHGLVVTKGSLFDMRAELMDSQSSDLWIGPYGHVNRLHTDLPGWEKWRREYDSSIAAMCGLGLLPIYEEAREKVAKYVWEVGCADPEPLSKAALMALATLIHNAPLLPTGVPFNGDMEWGPGSGGHPILDGLGEAFSLDLV